MTSELLILDVGHGNGAIIRHATGHVVIDAASGPTMLEALELEQITTIRVAIVSHSDADHIGGMITLLLDESIKVLEVRCNPDADKASATWAMFRHACGIAKLRDGTRVVPHLSVEATTEISTDGVLLQVLHPAGDFALSGVGGSSLSGDRLTPNTMSAVIRVVLDEVPIAVLAADADVVALRQLRDAGVDMNAPVLVFPHHGGLPNASKDETIAAFVREFLELVEPESVIVSHGRLKHNNPRPQVIEAALIARPNIHIACTQLSRRCSQDDLLQTQDHLIQRFAAGRKTGICCAGSISITVATPTLKGAVRDDHQAAIAHLKKRLCNPQRIPTSDSERSDLAEFD